MRLTALRLMRLALPLLDRAGEGIAAARLQHAIDTVGPSSPPPPEPDGATPAVGGSGGQ